MFLSRDESPVDLWERASARSKWELERMIDRLLPWTAHMHCDREVDSSGDDRRNQAETRNTSEPRSDSRGGRWKVDGGRGELMLIPSCVAPHYPHDCLVRVRVR